MLVAMQNSTNRHHAHIQMQDYLEIEMCAITYSVHNNNHKNQTVLWGPQLPRYFNFEISEATKDFYLLYYFFPTKDLLLKISFYLDEKVMIYSLDNLTGNEQNL